MTSSSPPPSPSSPEYFHQSSMIPSILITDWRIVRVAPGIIRVSVFERSAAAEGPEGSIIQVLHVRGSFCLSLDSFLNLADFLVELKKHWSEETPIPAPTNEGNRSVN